MSQTEEVKAETKEVTAQINMPPKLKPIFVGEARYRCSYGGRGSAKTRSFALMTAIRGYTWGRDGKSGQIVCGREFMNSLADSSLEEIKSAIQAVNAEGEYIYPWLVHYWEIGDNYIRSRDKQISYTFVGLRKSLDSIKSKARVLLAWVDEAETVSEIAWLKLIPTVREDNSEVWVTWNPESKKSATNERFRVNPPKNAKIVELNYRDNPWFPDVLEQERLNDKINRPEVYSHIWEGDYLDYVEGSYLKEQLMKAKDEGRITRLPKLDSQSCMTFWDIGNSDGTAIWVVQKVGNEYRCIHFYESWGTPYSHATKWLQGLGFVFDTHYLPHDADHSRQGQVDNKSPRQMLEALLPGNSFEVVPRIAEINWGIQQLRDMFPLFWFDDTDEGVQAGLEHLRSYRRRWSENDKRWLNKPDKAEGHSESADALRQLGQAYASGLLNVADSWSGKAIKRNLGGVV